MIASLLGLSGFKMIAVAGAAIAVVGAVSVGAAYVVTSERAKASLTLELERTREDLGRCRKGVSLLEDHALDLSRSGKELAKQCEIDNLHRAAFQERLDASRRRWASRPIPTPCPTNVSDIDSECSIVVYRMRDRLARITSREQGIGGDKEDSEDSSEVQGFGDGPAPDRP